MTFVLEIEGVGTLEVNTFDEAIIAQRNATFMGYVTNM